MLPGARQDLTLYNLAMAQTIRNVRSRSDAEYGALLDKHNNLVHRYNDLIDRFSLLGKSVDRARAERDEENSKLLNLSNRMIDVTDENDHLVTWAEEAIHSSMLGYRNHYRKEQGLDPASLDFKRKVNAQMVATAVTIWVHMHEPQLNLNQDAYKARELVRDLLRSLQALAVNELLSGEELRGALKALPLNILDDAKQVIGRISNSFHSGTSGQQFYRWRHSWERDVFKRLDRADSNGNRLGYDGARVVWAPIAVAKPGLLVHGKVPESMMKHALLNNLYRINDQQID